MPKERIQVMMRILSTLRRHLKDQYWKLNDRRYYYWIPSTVRYSTRELYKEAYPDISYKDYIENENTLFGLIHNAMS